MKLPNFSPHYRTIAYTVAGLAFVHLLLLVAYKDILNHDVAQYITMARTVMDGGVVYRDVMDTNPPLIIYLSFIPNLVSDWSGLDIVRSAHYCIVLLMAGMFFLLRAILRHIHGREMQDLSLVLLAVLMYLGVRFVFVNEFAQREHILTILLLPYLLLRVGAAGGKDERLWLTITAAALAVLALYLKPVFITIPLLIEGYVLFARRGSFDRRLLLMPGAMLLLGLLLLLWPPMNVYVFKWAGVFSSYYKAYGYFPKRVLWMELRDFDFHFIVLISALLLAFRSAVRDAVLRSLLMGLLLFLIGTFFALLVQGKGWYYHKSPMEIASYLSGAVLLFVLASGAWKETLDIQRGTAVTVAVLFLLQLMMYPVLLSMLRTGPPRAPGSELCELIVRHTKPDDYVASLSMGVGMQWPAITYTGRKYGMRYYSSYPVVMAYGGRPTETPYPDRKWIDEQFYSQFCADIAKYKAAMLTVEIVGQVYQMPDSMTMHTYLEGKGFFTGPGRDYHYLTDVEQKIRVYVREK